MSAVIRPPHTPRQDVTTPSVTIDTGNPALDTLLNLISNPWQNTVCATTPPFEVP